MPYVIYVIICSDDSGLVKLWNIKDNELVGTFEQHDERCWALTCDKSNQDRMITGCAGATITVWKVNKHIIYRLYSQSCYKKMSC